MNLIKKISKNLEITLQEIGQIKGQMGKNPLCKRKGLERDCSSDIAAAVETKHWLIY